MCNIQPVKKSMECERPNVQYIRPFCIIVAFKDTYLLLLLLLYNDRRLMMLKKIRLYRVIDGLRVLKLHCDPGDFFLEELSESVHTKKNILTFLQ